MDMAVSPENYEVWQTDKGWQITRVVVRGEDVEQIVLDQGYPTKEAADSAAEQMQAAAARRLR